MKYALIQMQQAHAPNQYQWPIAWDCCRNNIIIAMALFAARTSNGIIAARMGLTVKNIVYSLEVGGLKEKGIEYVHLCIAVK